MLTDGTCLFKDGKELRLCRILAESRHNGGGEHRKHTGLDVRGKHQKRGEASGEQERPPASSAAQRRVRGRCKQNYLQRRKREARSPQGMASIPHGAGREGTIGIC